MDIPSVINLGHKAKPPLIALVSELVDGLEPHDHIASAVQTRAVTMVPVTGVAGGVPGAVAGWVPGGVYRALPSLASLRLIYGYLRNNWFIRPFD